MELTKNDSKMLQGLSVLAMVCLHLFCRDYQGVFTPVVYLFGTPLSFYFGQISDFCVMGFAFISGYAHMTQIDNKGYYKRRLRALLILLIDFWMILLLFTAVSVIVGNGANMPGNISKFLMNFFLLENSYNGAWWYMFTFVVLVIISPITLKLIKKYNVIVILVVGFIIYSFAYYIRFKGSYNGWIFDKIGPFGMTLFEYLIGAVCFKTKIFTKIYNVWKKIPKSLTVIFSILVFAVLLFAHTKILQSLFIAPITGMVIFVMFHFWNKPKFVKSFFAFFGEHSTNIWLTHMFFFSKLFVDFVYIAKYPILIYVFTLVITVSVSYVFKFISKYTSGVVANKI